MEDFSGVKRHLTRFEALAQRLVEGSFSRLFGGELQTLDLAAHLARSMEDNQLNGLAPDVYAIHLHPRAYSAVSLNNQQLADELAVYIEQLAQQSSLTLVGTPDVRFLTDPNLPRHAISVHAEHGQSNAQSTQVHFRNKVDDISAAVKNLDAFLILEGRRHVGLEKPIISIGRRVDNDVVLESSAVSRRHAQLRWRFSRFVLYDMSGRGRTAVNGEVVTECVLQPGDVINLGGTLIIYGEGRDKPAETKPLLPDGDTQIRYTPTTEDA